MRQQRPHSPRKLLTATLGLAVVSHLGTSACGGNVQDGSGGATGTGAFTSGNLVGPPETGGVTSTDSGAGGLIGSGGVVLGTGAFTSGNLVAPCFDGTAGEGGAPNGYPYCDPEE